MGTPHVATHDRTCAGNPPVVDCKHTAGMSQQVEKGKGGGIPHILPASLLCFTFRNNSLHCARKKKKKKDVTLLRPWRPHLFCVFEPGPTRRDTPRPPLLLLLLLPWTSPLAAVERRSEGGEKSTSRLYFGAGSFLPLCGSQRRLPFVWRDLTAATRPGLCVIDKVSKTRQSL